MNLLVRSSTKSRTAGRGETAGFGCHYGSSGLPRRGALAVIASMEEPARHRIRADRHRFHPRRLARTDPLKPRTLAMREPVGGGALRERRSLSSP